MSQPTRSKIWDYFKVNDVDESKANCLICKDKVKRGGHDVRSYGTTGLIHHLRKKHHENFQEYSNASEEAKKRKLENEAQASLPKTSLRTLDAMFEKKQSFEPNHPRQIAITRKIGEMIASDVLPFKVVEKTDFLIGSELSEFPITAALPIGIGSEEKRLIGSPLL